MTSIIHFDTANNCAWMLTIACQQHNVKIYLEIIENQLSDTSFVVVYYEMPDKAQGFAH